MKEQKTLKLCKMCETCKNSDACGYYKNCTAYREWLKRTWTEIKEMFGEKRNIGDNGFGSSGK